MKRIVFLAALLAAGPWTRLWPDILLFKDGRKIEGEILQDKKETLKVKTRFGQYTFKKSEIESIQKGRSIQKQFKERLAAVSQEDAKGLFLLSNWCRKNRLYKERRDLLRKVLSIDPDHEEVRKALGYRKEGGQWVPAARGKEARKNKSKDRPPKVQEKQDEDKLPRASPAPKQTERTTQPDRQRAIDQYNKAMKAIDGGRYKDALVFLTSSVESDPTSPYPWSLRGYIHSVLRDIPEALADLNRCLELDPKFFNGLMYRAGVYHHLGQWAEAIADVKKAVKANSENKPARQYLKILKLVSEGPDWPKTYSRKTAHYIISTDVSQVVADRSAGDMERIYREYARQFHLEKEKVRKFNVRIFASGDDFEKYAGDTTGSALNWAAGYYTPKHKELIIRYNINREVMRKVLYHEGFHQFLDFFNSNVPFWFNEGLAQYFELAMFKGGKRASLGKVDKPKVHLLNRAFPAGAGLPVEKLLRLTPHEFQDTSPSRLANIKKVSIHYAESWAFVQFLIESNRGRYRRVIREYYLAMKAGKQPEEAFEEIFGKARFGLIDRALRGFISSL